MCKLLSGLSFGVLRALLQWQRRKILVSECALVASTVLPEKTYQFEDYLRGKDMEALLKELTSKETLKTIIVSLGQRSVDGAVGKGGKVRVQVTDINRLSHYSIYHFDPSTEIRDVKKRIIQYVLSYY